VATPLMHDTAAEIAQPAIRDWMKGEVEAIPGKSMPLWGRGKGVRGGTEHRVGRQGHRERTGSVGDDLSGLTTVVGDGPAWKSRFRAIPDAVMVAVVEGRPCYPAVAASRDSKRADPAAVGRGFLLQVIADVPEGAVVTWVDGGRDI